MKLTHICLKIKYNQFYKNIKPLLYQLFQLFFYNLASRLYFCVKDVLSRKQKKRGC